MITLFDNLSQIYENLSTFVNDKEIMIIDEINLLSGLPLLSNSKKSCFLETSKCLKRSKL